MSFIIDLFGKIFSKGGSQQEEGDYPISQATGKRLNPLYQPKPKRDGFIESEKIMDQYMRSFGYRKYLHGDRLPRPKRRFLRSKEKMQVGDTKLMAKIGKIKN